MHRRVILWMSASLLASVVCLYGCVYVCRPSMRLCVCYVCVRVAALDGRRSAGRSPDASVSSHRPVDWRQERVPLIVVTLFCLSVTDRSCLLRATIGVGGRRSSVRLIVVAVLNFLLLLAFSSSTPPSPCCVLPPRTSGLQRARRLSDRLQSSGSERPTLSPLRLPSPPRFS